MAPLASEVLEAFHSPLHWWRECASAYHDPTPFLPSLDALVESMRHATLRLQAHKSSIASFDEWYRPWSDAFASHPDLAWINDARLDAVHRKGLQRDSVATVEVFHSYLGPAIRTFSLSPYDTTDEIIAAVSQQLPEDVLQNSFFVITRRWSLAIRPDQEVLHLAAFGLNYLAALLSDCIQWIEAGTTAGPTSALSGEGPLSALLDFDAASLQLTVDPLTGQQYGLEQAPVEADGLSPELAAERYGLKIAAVHRVGDLPRDPSVLATAYEPLWRRFIEADGAVAPMLWLRTPDGSWQMLHVPVEDRKNKYMLWREIASLVEREGHDALLHVAEAWIAPIDAVPNVRYPSVKNATGRVEILAVYAATPDAVASWHYPIIRTVAGVALGERVAENPVEPTFLTAILRVWEKRSEPAPTSQPAAEDVDA